MIHKRRVRFVLLVSFILNIGLVSAQAPPGYYSSVDDSNPSALKVSLHNIIDDHTRIPYTSSSTDTWDILELAGEDVDNSSRVIALYKNSDYAKVNGGNNNYNREHSWPKSYGFPDDNSGNYPYTDMHHLFIANSSYNSSRSNKPFDICTSDCTEKPTDVNNGRGGSGQSNFTKTGIWDVWEARQGDVARAMFYMAVRYEGGSHSITNRTEPDLELTDNLTLIENSQTGSNESQAYMGLLSVLINWHNSDPVDIYEHQHNEAVASAQGNRNPFIDHPEWVECVFELVCNGGGSDTTAPSSPTNLSGSAASIGLIELDWFNNTEADLAGYNVYRSTSSGSGFVKLNNSLVNTSNYSDSSVALDTQYYYRTTAADNSGNESSNSSQISVTSLDNSQTNNVLTNGVAKTGLSGNQGNEQNFTLTVPAGASNLSFNINGGSGDADLYVRYGAAPTQSSYDCRPYIGGNNESCDISSAQSGTYYVMIRAYSTYSGLSLIGSYTNPTTSNNPPVASFTSSCNDLSCSFNASNSDDSDGSIVNYSWSFGGSSVSANYTFASAGTYSVTLIVTDNDGATDASSQSITVTAAPVNSAPNALFTSNCSNLTCSFNGSGSSDSDGSIVDYSWSFGGSGSTASNTYSNNGTYNVTLTVTDNDGASDSTTQSVTVTAASPGNVLDNNVVVSGLSASVNNSVEYSMIVPTGASSLSFNISGGSGDADIYVRYGSEPTTSNYDCRPYIGGNNETCNISSVQTGTYYIMVRAYSAFSGVSLIGSYSTGQSSGEIFSTTTNANIPDNNSTGVTSTINVSRTGVSNDIKITYSIVHTYIGDLTIQLISPSGSVTTLRNPSGGSANNINDSNTLNLGSTAASGNWGLKVIDSAGADTGYIDSWSIEFL
ncbi:MAG: pre-peptidase C-terminal domain-containing protein [Marinicellaceae bacterium]